MKTGKVLITGANGLLGQAVVSIFSRESELTLIQTSVENDPFVDYGIDYHKLDITNKEEVKEAVKTYSPDVILNCAAFTDVDKCETERELCWKLNVDAVKNLIIGSRVNNCKLVHISTDYIFDGKSGPYSETEIPNPISFYGRSKLASENAITTSGINFAIARTMVLYGLGVKVKPNFALWLINKLTAGEPVRIVKDQIGNSTLVDDLAYGLLKLIESNKTGIYNLAGKDIESRYDFAMTVCDVFNFDKKHVSSIMTADLNQPAPRPLNSGLITLKAETELGFKPMNSLDGLRLLKYQLGL